MHVYNLKIITLVLLIQTILPENLVSQYIDIREEFRIANIEGDEINTSWSPDGNNIVFENMHANKSSLYIYKVFEDKLVYINNDGSNFSNPVWHPVKVNKLVFDKKTNSYRNIYTIDTESFTIKPLLNREINCYGASFTPSGRIVYFTGYNEIEQKWEIYSYDFVYDNLNEVSDLPFNCNTPKVSRNGKMLVFRETDPFNNETELNIMNWYGENCRTLTEEHCYSYTWDPAGLKLYFVAKDSSGIKQLYSIWKDGTNMEQLTKSNFGVSSPSVSPDGSLLSISVKGINGFDIYIIPFDDY